jgi:hypothetical protein
VWRRRGSRRLPALSIAYAAVLAATGAWLETASAATESRVLHATSTDLAHLVHDPWLVLPASAFFTQGGLGYAVIGCLVCVGLLEVSAGWWVTLAVAASAHVIGTAVSEGVVAIRIATGDVPSTARHTLDVGPSYVIVGCAAAVIFWREADRRARVVCAVTVLPLFAFTAWRLPSGHIDAMGHLTAAVVGASWALWLHRRARVTASAEHACRA